MDQQTRDFVRQRAGDCCEYCRTPQAMVTLISFHVEHIIAKQHQLDDSRDNLALSCHRCNAYKGPNLSSIDPETSKIVELFHPRRDVWSDHFLHTAGQILGRSPIGRATARLLNMNERNRVDLRLQWLAEGNSIDPME